MAMAAFPKLDPDNLPDNLRGVKLVYPLHSLVVYKPPANDISRYGRPPFMTGQKGWLVEVQRRFHYLCPKEWRATASADVKVVAIMYGSGRLIGHYTDGTPALGVGWNEAFFDLVQRRFVAVGPREQRFSAAQWKSDYDPLGDQIGTVTHDIEI